MTGLTYRPPLYRKVTNRCLTDGSLPKSNKFTVIIRPDAHHTTHAGQKWPLNSVFPLTAEILQAQNSPAEPTAPSQCSFSV